MSTCKYFQLWQNIFHKEKLYHKTSNRKKNIHVDLKNKKKSCCISHRENAFKTFGWKCNKNRLSSHSLRGLQHICIRNRHHDAHSVEKWKINSQKKKSFHRIKYFAMSSITLSYLVNVDTYSHLCSFYYIKNVCSSEIIIYFADVGKNTCYKGIAVVI